MAGTVGDKLDLIGVASLVLGLEFVEGAAKGVHDIQIFLLVVPADVVGLTRGSFERNL